jgi:hypothetical protein
MTDLRESTIAMLTEELHALRAEIADLRSRAVLPRQNLGGMPKGHKIGSGRAPATDPRWMKMLEERWCAIDK